MILNDMDIKQYCTSPVFTATNGPMIDPFVEGVSGDGVISYGLSSCGYDIRLGKDIYCLKSSFGEVINPKRFKEQGYRERIMDHRVYNDGDMVIVPANGYVLGTSLERFNIPPHLMARCLGKSTLARCFTGDVRVALIDGSRPTFEELTARYDAGEEFFYGYGFKEGSYIVQPLTFPRIVGENESVVEVVLDNEEIIRCTPDHVFLLRNGKTRKAGRLKIGDSLLPLYLNDSHGYESVFNPLTRTWRITHRLVEEMLIRHGVWENRPDDFHIHHKDRNKRNNVPDNLTRMHKSDHAREHNKDKDCGEIFRKLWADPVWREQHLRKMHSEEAGKKRVATMRRLSSTEEWQKMYKERNRLIWEKATDERRAAQAEIARAINLRSDVTEDTLVQALLKEGTIRGAARLLNVDRTAFRRFPAIMEKFRQGELKNNHKVAGVRKVRGKHDVYCLTAPETGNFALASGVLVNNCAVSINVTPLEPSWRGQLTIEIGNSGPAPVGVFVGEGIAQIIFETLTARPLKTYADKHNGSAGKYMDQTGVTMPIVL